MPGELMVPAELVERARSLAVRARADDRRAVLGIAGAPGSGKSTLAAGLVAALAAEPPEGSDATWVRQVPMDGFHLADVELDRLGLRGRKGAPETFDVAGYVALLERLHADGSAGAGHGSAVVYAPAFDRVIEQPVAGAIPIGAATRLVVTEGNYLLLDAPGWRDVRALLDEVWFCSGDEDVRRERLVARHVEFGKSPDAARAWVERSDEANARVVARTRGSADLVVAVG
ncbi:UNVERIFIED_CONTAM: fructose transporter [Mumia flava]